MVLIYDVLPIGFGQLKVNLKLWKQQASPTQGKIRPKRGALNIFASGLFIYY